jgi:hypothetical protein
MLKRFSSAFSALTCVALVLALACDLTWAETTVRAVDYGTVEAIDV